MKKKEPTVHIPDIKEFTDENGKKWIQTSTEDLFSVKELNDIIKNIEKERETGEVLLARIDFQKVDQQFYDAAINLQNRLQKQTLLLRKYVAESNKISERKNKKLRELIDYIKNLHRILAYLQAAAGTGEKIDIPEMAPADTDKAPAFVSEYETVEETVVNIEESD